MPDLTAPSKLFSRSPIQEARRLAEVLRNETVGGFLLLAGTVLALVWVNSPWAGGYQALSGYRLGPHTLHLDLSLSSWAADGLLAIFFFVAGIELKHEFLHGSLRGARRAAVPIVSALAGVAVPALIYLALTRGDPVATSGWAIPTATDIAFALAVLAVLGSHLPNALRAFLLSLAVVDDLVAITIIAIAYTSNLHPVLLLGSLIPLVLFSFGARRGWHGWLLIPIAFTCWAMVHASGIHATVAGVLLGLSVPMHRAERFEHRIRPLSAGVAVPIFALFAAGVAISPDAIAATLDDPVFLGVVAGLVLGKAVGVMAGAYLTARFTRAELDDDLAWWDVFGLSLLAGIGFTVSLLIGELAFGQGSERDAHAKLAVLTGSVIAALLAAVVLRVRNRVYLRLDLAEAGENERHQETA